jgi:hypothetical protein
MQLEETGPVAGSSKGLVRVGVLRHVLGLKGQVRGNHLRGISFDSPVAECASSATVGASAPSCGKGGAGAVVVAAVIAVVGSVEEAGVKGDVGTVDGGASPARGATVVVGVEAADGGV